MLEHKGVQASTPRTHPLQLFENDRAVSSGLFNVLCTVRYAFHCTYRNFVDHGVIMIFEDIIHTYDCLSRLKYRDT